MGRGEGKYMKREGRGNKKLFFNNKATYKTEWEH